MIEWKWDWMHVVIGIAGLGCMTTVIVLGHGQTALQVIAALGGTSGVLALLKPSPAKAAPAIIVTEDPK